jgi:predicted O-methyltransferase YrrM
MASFGRFLKRTRIEDPVDNAVRIAREIEGQISPKELRVLVHLASKVAPDNVVVEIGTYRGRSTVALALGSRTGSGSRVYTIDPHLDFKGVKGGEFGPKDMAALYANLTKAGVGETVAVICLPSLVSAKAWMEQNVGLLWLDGDHAYEAVRGDFDAWSPWLVSDGVVAFHDVDVLGVKQLMDELRQDTRLEFVDTVGILTWMKTR